jgi:hypothetical protein
MFWNARITCVLVSLAGVLLLIGCSQTPPPKPPQGVEMPKTFAEFTRSDPALHTVSPATGDLVDTDLKVAGVQYIGLAERLEKQLSLAEGADDTLSLKYYECAEGAKPVDVKKTEPSITTYVAFNKSVVEAFNRRAITIPDVVYPQRGYTLDRTETITLDTPGYAGGETKIQKSVIYNGSGEWILVYYHMNKNGAIVSRDKINALKNWQKLPQSETKGFLAQVEFYTVIGQGKTHADGIEEAEIVKAQARLDKFVPIFLAKLNEFLPEPVK